MNIDYRFPENHARALLKNHGKVMSLRRVQTIADPGTGMPVEETIAEQLVKAVRVSFERRYDNNVSVIDFRYFIEAKYLDSQMHDLGPLGEMRLIDNETNNTLRFKNVRAIIPGDAPLLFDVQAH